MKALSVLRFLLLSFIITASFISVKAHGSDEEYSTLNHVPKPYLILNIRSSDCFGHQSYIVDFLRNISSENLGKVFILSDEKQMGAYLKRNSDALKKLSFAWNKNLSDSLSDNNMNSICLVQESGMTRYRLDEKLNANADYINKVLGPNDQERSLSHKPFSSQIFKDTTISSYSKISKHKGSLLILDNKFQTGSSIQNNTIEHTDLLSQDSGKWHAIATKLLKGLKVIPLDSSRKTLNMLAQPLSNFKSIQNGTLLFWGNICYESASSDLTKADKEIRIQKYPFFAWQIGDGNPFYISAYKNLCLIDSFRIADKDYYPILSKGYAFHKGSLYLPFHQYKSNDLDVAPEIVIVSLHIAANKKASIKALYPTHKTTDSLADYFFKVDDQGFPIIVDKMNENILFLSNNETIGFQTLSGTPDLHYLYDLRMDNLGAINYIGVLHNKSVATGTYEKHGKAKYTLLQNKLYTDAIIDDKGITALYKDEDNDTLQIDDFEFSNEIEK